MINPNLLNDIPVSKILDFETNVKALNAGLTPIDECRVATTQDITLNGEVTIDGVSSLPINTRVLVKHQNDPTENGIYLKKSGAWVRAFDFDEDSEIQRGSFTYIKEGNTNANQTFMVSNQGSGENYKIVIGVDNILFTTTNLAIPATLEYMLNLEVNPTTGFTNATGSGENTGVIIDRDFRGRLLIMGSNGSKIYSIDSQTTINDTFYLSNDGGVTATKNINGSELFVNAVKLGRDFQTGDEISVVGMIGSNTPVATLEAALDNKADLVNGKLDPSQMPNIYIHNIYDSAQQSIGAFIATELNALITNDEFQQNDTVSITDGNGIKRLYTAYYSDLYDVASYIETQTFEGEAGNGLSKTGRTYEVVPDNTLEDTYEVIMDGFTLLANGSDYVDGKYEEFSQFIATPVLTNSNVIKIKGETGFPETETARAFYKDNGDNTWTIFFKRSFDNGGIRNDTQWVYAKVTSDPTTWIIVNDFVLDGLITGLVFTFTQSTESETHPEEVLVNGAYNPPVNGQDVGTTATTNTVVVGGAYMEVTPNGVRALVSKDLDFLGKLPNYLTTRETIGNVLELYQKLLVAGYGVSIDDFVNGIISLQIADTNVLVELNGYDFSGFSEASTNGHYVPFKIGSIDDQLIYTTTSSDNITARNYLYINGSNYNLLILKEYATNAYRWDIITLSIDPSTLTDGSDLSNYTITYSRAVTINVNIDNLSRIIEDGLEAGIKEMAITDVLVGGTITKNYIYKDLSGLVLTPEGIKVKTSDLLDLNFDAEYLIFRGTLKKILELYQEKIEFIEGLQEVNGDVNLRLNNNIREVFNVEAFNLEEFGGTANGEYISLNKSAIIREISGELIWYTDTNNSYPVGLDSFHTLIRTFNGKYYVIAFQDSYTTTGVAKWVYFETDNNPDTFVEGDDITPNINALHSYFDYTGGRFDNTWTKVDGAFIPPENTNVETSASIVATITNEDETFVEQNEFGIFIKGSRHPNLKVLPTHLLARGTADIILEQFRQELIDLINQNDVNYVAGKYINAAELSNNIIASSLNFESVNEIIKNATFTHSQNLGGSEILKGDYTLLGYGIFETLDTDEVTNGFVFRSETGGNYPAEFVGDKFAIYSKTEGGSNQLIIKVKRLSDSNYYWTSLITQDGIFSLSDGDTISVFNGITPTLVTTPSVTVNANETQITDDETYYRPTTFVTDLSITYNNVINNVDTGLVIDELNNVTVNRSDSSNWSENLNAYSNRGVIYDLFESNLVKGKISSTLNVPPVSPSLYDSYIIGTGFGNWTGQDNNIAWWDGVSWSFKIISKGDVVYDTTSEVYLKFDGVSWTRLITTTDNVGGNILVVNNQNSEAGNPSRTDAIDYGLQYNNLQNAVDNSLSGDRILFLSTVNDTANVNKTLSIESMSDTTLTINYSNSGGGSTLYISGKRSTYNISIGSGNGIFLEAQDIKTLSLVTNNTGNNGTFRFKNVDNITGMSSGVTGSIIRADIFNCKIVGDIIGTQVIINANNILSMGDIYQNESGTGILDVKLKNVKKCGQLKISTRNSFHYIRLEQTKIYTDLLPCIETIDTNQTKITMLNCVLRSNNTNAITINSSLSITADLTLNDVLIDGAVVVNGLSGAAPTINYLLQNNVTTVATTTLDELF